MGVYINQNYYDWGSITLDISASDGDEFRHYGPVLDFQTINYNHGKTKLPILDFGGVPASIQRGNYQVQASISMLMDQFQLLHDFLYAEYGNFLDAGPIDIKIQYGKDKSNDVIIDDRTVFDNKGGLPRRGSFFTFRPALIHQVEFKLAMINNQAVANAQGDTSNVVQLPLGVFGGVWLDGKPPANNFIDKDEILETIEETQPIRQGRRAARRERLIKKVKRKIRREIGLPGVPLRDIFDIGGVKAF